MKMSGEQRVAAPRDAVWKALNDPAVLKQCIPGCQSLDADADGRMKAVVAIKVGPIGAKFTGAVTIEDPKPPESYRIVGEGQGGAAGFAKGGATVRLAAEGRETLLSYEVDAQVGGRIAQLGGALIDATARRLAGLFFDRFGDIVAGGGTAALPGTATAAASAAGVAAVPAPVLARVPGGGTSPARAAAVASVATSLLTLAAVFAGFQLGRRRDDARRDAAR